MPLITLFTFFNGIAVKKKREKGRKKQQYIHGCRLLKIGIADNLKIDFTCKRTVSSPDNNRSSEVRKSPKEA